jgi:hypothetical protein
VPQPLHYHEPPYWLKGAVIVSFLYSTFHSIAQIRKFSDCLLGSKERRLLTHWLNYGVTYKGLRIHAHSSDLKPEKKPIPEILLV